MYNILFITVVRDAVYDVAHELKLLLGDAASRRRRGGTDCRIVFCWRSCFSFYVLHHVRIRRWRIRGSRRHFGQFKVVKRQQRTSLLNFEY
jgi:hypothetical protein